MTERSSDDRLSAVAENIKRISANIQSALVKAGRTDTVRLMGVTKTVDPEIVSFSVKNGVKLLGENSVSLLRKAVYGLVGNRTGVEFLEFFKMCATFDDIRLFKAHCAPHLKIKAAGGISSIADAEEFIRLGADRLGTSRIVKIVKAQGLL